MTMPNETTREIPREEWVDFFDGFGQQHSGWLVTLELLDRELGAQLVAENLPLRGISSDVQENDEDVILINVGETPDEHINHAIAGPVHVRLKQTAQGAHEALDIETMSGATTLLRFRVTALPETVDGVMAHETQERAAP